MFTTSSRFAMLSVALLCGCDLLPTPEVGSGTALSETRQVPAFDSVDLSGGAELEILSGQLEPKCEIEFDDNLLPFIKAEVTEKQLRITFSKSTTSSLPLRIRLSTAQLKQLSVSGSVSGKIENLDEPELSIEISGSGNIQCFGKAKKLEIDGSGSSSIDCLELSVEEAKIDISGSGEVAVQASRTLDVDISGSGKVRYRGEPTITEDISGSGSIARVEE